MAESAVGSWSPQSHFEWMTRIQASSKKVGTRPYVYVEISDLLTYGLAAYMHIERKKIAHKSWSLHCSLIRKAPLTNTTWLIMWQQRESLG